MKSCPMLLLACVLTVGGGPAPGSDSGLHVVDTSKKMDTSTYAGTVTAVDAAKFTLTINGHEVSTTVHQKKLTHDSSTAKPKPPSKDAPKDASRHFVIDPGCRVVGLEKIPIPLNEIHTNNLVVAKFNVTKDFDRKTTFVISEIDLTKVK